MPDRRSIALRVAPSLRFFNSLLADLLACEARPVALGALFIFGTAAERFAAEQGLALEGVARMSFGMWKPAECPLCAAGGIPEKVSDALPAHRRG